MGLQGFFFNDQRTEQEGIRNIEQWRNRPLEGGKYPYVYVDGIYLKRNWGGEYENVAILVAIAVNEDGYREVLGAAEGMKEDKESWKEFFSVAAQPWIEGHQAHCWRQVPRHARKQLVKSSRNPGISAVSFTFIAMCFLRYRGQRSSRLR